MLPNSKNLLKKDRMLRKRDFLRARSEGERLRLFELTLYIAARPPLENSEGSRIGISISGKAGNSVKRNYLKRVIKEFYRNSRYKGTGKDYFVIINPSFSKSFSLGRALGMRVEQALSVAFQNAIVE